MKLWNKKEKLDKIIEKFTIGNDPDFDMILARYDVMGSMAHVRMLKKVELISDKECQILVQGLEEILNEINQGTFTISEGIEDIHSQIEILLTERYGDAGKKLHTARSRNDQIATDLKLYYRDILNDLFESVKELAFHFLHKADATRHLLMPGYTHSQVGMVSSFGLWYASFAESLSDDLVLLKTVIRLVDQNPLGSAAGYGSSLPIDRNYTTAELGFSDLLINPVYAQVSRGRGELFIGFALQSLATTINRFASDVCLYSNENYRFLNLPEAFTTGSSIMPHKKNPDVMELVRAKCNRVVIMPVQVQMILGNMQTGYHRDYQLLKEVVFPNLDKMVDIISVLNYCVPHITEEEGIMLDSKYKLCYTVERINELIAEGVHFRDAYHQVKEEVVFGHFEVKNYAVNHSHAGSIGNLGLNRIEKKIMSA